MWGSDRTFILWQKASNFNCYQPNFGRSSLASAPTKPTSPTNKHATKIFQIPSFLNKHNYIMPSTNASNHTEPELKDPTGTWFEKVDKTKSFLHSCDRCKGLHLHCYSGIIEDHEVNKYKKTGGMKTPCARCGHLKRGCEGAVAVDENSDSDEDIRLPPPLSKSAPIKTKSKSAVPEIEIMTPQVFKGRRRFLFIGGDPI